jgi:hypothetical protein
MPHKRKYLSKAFNDIVTKPNRSSPRPMPYPSSPTISSVQSSPSLEYASAAKSLRRDSLDLNSFKPSRHDFNHLESDSLDFSSPDFNNSSVNVTDFNVSDLNVPDVSVPDISIPGSNDFNFNDPFWNDMSLPASPATHLPNTAQPSHETPRKRPKQSNSITSVYNAPEPFESCEKPPTPPPDLCDKQTDLNHPQSPPAGSDHTIASNPEEPRKILEHGSTRHPPTPPPTPTPTPSRSTKSDNYHEADALKSSIKSNPPYTIPSVSDRIYNTFYIHD